MKLLITGGAGFIGSNFVRHIFNKYPDYTIINLDKLTYAGNLDNLKDIADIAGDGSRYRFVRGDVSDKAVVESILTDGVDAVINFAAESHVDRSIDDSRIFVDTNVVGTTILLDACLKYKINRYVQISTDEVYGSLGPTGKFSEITPLAPNSPYSASKTSADLFVRAYYETYGMNTLITRCSNNYGPYQFPEKLIPLFITNAYGDNELPLYGDGMNIRDWIFVTDHCCAIDLVLHKGIPGQVYNIGGNEEKDNTEITKTILKAMNKPASLIKYVKDRPGHDRRYAIDDTKIKKELGWTQEYDFETGMNETVKWYLDNKEWWDKIKTGEYLEFYSRWYEGR